MRPLHSMAPWRASSSRAVILSLAPRRLRLVGGLVYVAGEDKQQVREAVQVAHELRVHALLPRQANSSALGAAAHGAAEMQQGAGPRPRGQNERAQRRDP